MIAEALDLRAVVEVVAARATAVAARGTVARGLFAAWRTRRVVAAHGLDLGPLGPAFASLRPALGARGLPIATAPRAPVAPFVATALCFMSASRLTNAIGVPAFTVTSGDWKA